MKQKINTLLWGCVALLTSITINAQELKGWHLAPKLIDMQGSTPVVRPTAFTTNNASPGSNSVYDSEGKLLFYIANSTSVFNKFNQLHWEHQAL